MSTHCRIDSIDFRSNFPRTLQMRNSVSSLTVLMLGIYLAIFYFGGNDIIWDKYLRLLKLKPNQSFQDVDMERCYHMVTSKNPKSEPMERPATGPSTNVSLSTHVAKNVKFCCGFCLSPLWIEFLYVWSHEDLWVVWVNQELIPKALKRGVSTADLEPHGVESEYPEDPDVSWWLWNLSPKLCSRLQGLKTKKVVFMANWLGAKTSPCCAMAVPTHLIPSFTDCSSNIKPVPGKAALENAGCQAFSPCDSAAEICSMACQEVGEAMWQASNQTGYRFILVTGYGRYPKSG